MKSVYIETTIISYPIVRSTCAVAGYVCPEICTPMELMSEEDDDATG